MGCLCAKLGFLQPQDEPEQHSPKQYSWDKRESQINVKDYIIENLKDEMVGRLPGTVAGQQLVIQNCENCNIYIFDHSSTITVDDCINCNIFLGPIKTSVFIRDCKDCRLVVACQQFRTRDCLKIDVFLCCDSQPIIESSSGMKFGCFQYHYPELAGQFQAAGLSVFNNNWSNIHDFTQDPVETHYGYLPEDAVVEEIVPLPTIQQFSSMQIKVDVDSSVVPKTMGRRRKHSDESCLVVFFSDGGSHDRALSLIKKLKAEHPDCTLVQTKEVTMQPQDAQRVFGSDSYDGIVQQGPVIGLEFNGEGVIQYCQESIVELMTGTTGLVFISSNKSTASNQIENFYNFADMQMMSV